MVGNRRGWFAPTLGLAMSMMSLLAWAPAGDAQTIIEYPIPTPNTSPFPITTGPDGALWFVTFCNSPCNPSTYEQVGQITTGGTVTIFSLPPAPSVSIQVVNITSGPDGALWFTYRCASNCNGPSSGIGRITTSGAVTYYPLPGIQNFAGGIVAGSDGALWFGDNGLSAIGRITTSGVITEFPILVAVGCGLQGGDMAITAGPDGALWFTMVNPYQYLSCANKIGRITTSGTITEYPLPTSNGYPTGIAAGPDGAVWFTENVGNKIGRITTSGTITEFPVPTPNANIIGIASGPDGALWFTEALPCNLAAVCPSPEPAKIGRITTSGTITEYALADAGLQPFGIAAGPDGAMWFTESGINKIGRITVPAASGGSLVSAVLPSSRSIVVNGTATAFATIINAGTATATGCAITPVSPVAASFTYQTTNPATNALSGSPNTPVTIPPGKSQSFVIALTAAAAFAPTTVTLGFDCAGIDAAASSAGLNTLLYSASTTPVPDIVALGAVATNDGILHIAGTTGSNAFAVATVNVGASGAITATANTGSATLPLAISLCQTNPQSGQCLAPPAASATATIAAGATPTFAFFATASGTVPFIPQTNRIFVQFSDASGTVRGSTSVAVQTQ